MTRPLSCRLAGGGGLPCTSSQLDPPLFGLFGFVLLAVGAGVSFVMQQAVNADIGCFLRRFQLLAAALAKVPLRCWFAVSHRIYVLRFLALLGGFWEPAVQLSNSKHDDQADSTAQFLDWHKTRLPHLPRPEDLPPGFDPPPPISPPSLGISRAVSMARRDQLEARLGWEPTLHEHVQARKGALRDRQDVRCRATVYPI
jgi:hypothetical protein